ncbi:leucine-rich repeat domain-containing protein [Candidatus Comchoanobacter bicostacola]|uniref:Leucine-rich repeat domain-containing protein n=1 Tax=Candidatus Comchoanobacter bicostacola TaxID=2919598 RepID=A0ABY5DK53_9GAMM|nr:leucine-rich repeat domain-containing protein [Candidatus Comchoanobacter bicostacola]UTC24202.1 leucine-rich repeat domain-containing protein [Candidatus Comchoanobacter bicostacola]
MEKIELRKVHHTDGNTYYLHAGVLRGFEFGYRCTAVDLPKVIKRIAPNVFKDCKALVSVIMSHEVLSIGWNAFLGCANLSVLQLSSQLAKINHAAFAGCTKLTDIMLPSSVSYIGMRAFYGCSSLSRVCITNDHSTYVLPHAFTGCSKVKFVLQLV